MNSHAKVIVSPVEYKEGTTTLEGLVAYDTQFSGKRPGILVFPDWMGVGPNVKSRIEKLAELGYVAFAGDIYGKNARPNNQSEAGKKATIYKNNRTLMRKRAVAALQALEDQKNVDPNQIVAMGYCFGGTNALELGRSGAKLKGIVTFHGGLDTPSPSDGKNIQGEVLAFHGADDPFVPQKDVEAFEKEMKDGKVKWELVIYGGAVHSFTLPTAGNDPSTGQAYNPEADAKSWESLKLFLKRVFRAS